MIIHIFLQFLGASFTTSISESTPGSPGSLHYSLRFCAITVRETPQLLKYSWSWSVLAVPVLECTPTALFQKLGRLYCFTEKGFDLFRE